MFRLFDLAALTLERIWQHKLLVLWVLIGLIVATTLTLSLSLYVDSVYSELLETRLDVPPFAFRFRYLGAWNGNIAQADVMQADAAVSDAFATAINLPIQQSVAYVRGGTWTIDSNDGLRLGAYGVGTLQGANAGIQIVAGEWPVERPVDDRVPVLVSETMLFRTGLQVGDQLTARLGGQQVQMVVAAMWRPVNANDPSWIFTPRFFDEIFLVESEVLWRILDGIEAPIDETAWYLVFDGSEVRTSDVETLLSSIINGQRRIDAVLPGIRQDVSPLDGLTAFNNEVTQLTNQLFILIAPVGGLVLYFVSLVAGLLISRQQIEDVKLRSRGMSRRALLLVHILMWGTMVVVAVIVAILIGPLLVHLIGQTASFLRFDAVASVSEVVMTVQAVSIAVFTGVVAASSGVFMAWRTTRQNINSYQRGSVRSSKAWWQRMYLDVMLLFPAIYVLYTLWQRGGLVTDVETPFADPLTFVGPTLFALGMALLFIRVWSMTLSILARLIAFTANIALLMALRELTRSIGRYRGALLMMTFTLSLTGFTASMASTVDQSLEDSINYRVGADMVLVMAIDPQTESGQNADTGQTEFTVTGYNIPPMEELLEVDGIDRVARVGRYVGRLIIGGQRIDGTVLGIDRGSMADVTLYRQDYARDSLAAIFNRLAGQRTGVILNRQMAEEYNLVIGQEVVIQVQALNTWYEARVPVIDFVDYFPTLDPTDGFFAITNIDPVFEIVGTVLPYDIWLRLQPNVDESTIQQQIAAIDFPVLRWLQPQSELEAAQAEPARRGVFGFLSVGFVASIILTLIASIVQSAASFRAQSTQLGALRAMGLSGFTVGMYVFISQGLAALSGIASGTLIGVATTLFFLPLMDFSGGLPPYLVRVAWDEIAFVYLLFAVVLLLVTFITTLFLGREQAASIIRIGA